MLQLICSVYETLNFIYSSIELQAEEKVCKYTKTVISKNVV